MSEKHIYIMYKCDNNEEMRIQGTPKLIGEFMRAFIGDDSLHVGNFTKVDEVDGALWDMGANTPQQEMNFLSFYRSLAPSNQTEEVLVITFYHQKFLGMASLTLAEYEKAYTELRLIPVEPPNNLKSSVRNVVDRSPYLRNAERGSYTLTLKGEEYVHAMHEKALSQRE